MLPQLRQWDARIRFYVVGRNPTPAIRALASEGVIVTGTVADVRPFLQHAAAVVAPMRIARGVQNKVLEAMSMGRPIVAASDCVDAISARDGQELVTARLASDFVDAIQNLLSQPDAANRIGVAGRACVVQRFSWDAHLSGVDPYLSGDGTGADALSENHVPA
jgi:glycosyltransferase involved in cell wall biosynthesis